MEEDPAAERLHAVLEANEAGAAAEIGTAGAVVVDGDAQDSVCGVGLDGDRERRGAGMLGRVGQRFGDDKVGRDLDRLRETARGAHVEFDRDRGAAGECFQRRPQSAFGEDGRVNAACELAQIIESGVESGRDAVQLPGEIGRRGRLRLAQLQRQRDQPLLGAVVQVALEALARLVGGGDDPRA